VIGWSGRSGPIARLAEPEEIEDTAKSQKFRFNIQLTIIFLAVVTVKFKDAVPFH
jgi:hypothetical protein